MNTLIRSDEDETETLGISATMNWTPNNKKLKNMNGYTSVKVKQEQN